MKLVKPCVLARDSVAVIIHHGQKQAEEERVHFILHFQLTAHH